MSLVHFVFDADVDINVDIGGDTNFETKKFLDPSHDLSPLPWPFTPETQDSFAHVPFRANVTSQV